MLSKEEEQFVIYWEKNRLRRKKTMRQFLLGIPAGLLIVVPIVINFSSGWYRRANMEANSDESSPMVLFIALLLIVGFTAVFWQKHQWDQLEQRYRELLNRRGGETPATTVTDAPPTDPPGTDPSDTTPPDRVEDKPAAAAEGTPTPNTRPE